MILNFMAKYQNEIIEIILFFVAIYVLFKLIDIFNKKSKEKVLIKHIDKSLLSFMPLVEKILKIIVVFICLALVLQNHGYSITSLITGLGITGLAVGFGAQATIANVFGSFSLLADNAYKIGDYIVIDQTVQGNAVEGIVEDINLRSTKIRCSDGGLLIIPNNIVANGVVKNIPNLTNN